MLEDSRFISLDCKHTPAATRFGWDSIGRFTGFDIESILLNPVYAFGVAFGSDDMLRDWMDAFFYHLGIQSFEIEFGLSDVTHLYDVLLDGLMERFDYCEAETIVEKTVAYKVIYQHIARVRDYLTGNDSDDAGIARDFTKRMPQQLYQLCHLDFLFEKATPRWRASSKDDNLFSRVQFKEMMERLDEGTNHDRGLALEELATYFFSPIEEWRVVNRRVRTFNGEVDLCLCNFSLEAWAWRLGAVLLVECKNRKAPATLNMLRNFYYMVEDKGASAGILFSSGGFTAPAREEAIRMALREITILLVDREDLRRISEGIHPKDILLEKIEEIRAMTEDDVRLLYG